MGKQSDRQKTVGENGKDIPKVGKKDGNKESWPDQQLVRKKGKELKVKKRTQCRL